MLATVVLLLTGVLLFLFIEYYFHRRNLMSIPIRIHVNGTRGKSSVTRLIAGALREHGLKTCAKTTGTLPRMIMEDGREYPVYRPAGANIIEQLRIISFAAHRRAQALIIECMALQPHLQSLTELKFIRATHGVITNARADHLDVMGPSESDVVMALLGTVPHQGKVFTCERDYLTEFREVCDDRDSQLHVVEPHEIADVDDKDMAGFKYVEHKENVALVLKVCTSLGISRDTALRGMWKTPVDPGVMSEYHIDFFGRKIVFVNGFAANDPESSERIWKMALDKHPNVNRKIMVLNARADRPDRSKQLGEALVKWPLADRYVLMGSGVYGLFRTAVASGLDSSLFVYAEGRAVNQIFEEIVGLCSTSAMVMGIGNIGGPGLELVNYFRNRTILELG
jgi:poly-gamma-glutamate synthase PgsB/CapB